MNDFISSNQTWLVGVVLAMALYLAYRLKRSPKPVRVSDNAFNKIIGLFFIVVFFAFWLTYPSSVFGVDQFGHGLLWTLCLIVLLTISFLINKLNLTGLFVLFVISTLLMFVTLPITTSSQSNSPIEKSVIVIPILLIYLYFAKMVTKGYKITA